MFDTSSARFIMTKNARFYYTKRDGSSETVLFMGRLTEDNRTEAEAIISNLTDAESLVIDLGEKVEYTLLVSLLCVLDRADSPVKNVVIVNCMGTKEPETVQDIIDAICAMPNIVRLEVVFPETWTSTSVTLRHLCECVTLNTGIKTLAFNDYKDPTDRNVKCFERVLTKGGLTSLEIRYRVYRDAEPIERVNGTLAGYAAATGKIESLSLSRFLMDEKDALWMGNLPLQFKELHLRGASGDHEAWRSIMDGCAKSPKLRVLDIDAYDPGKRNFGSVLFINVLSECKHLEVLRYVNCYISSKDAEDFAAVMQNSKLHTLDLRESDPFLSQTFDKEAWSIVDYVSTELVRTVAQLAVWPYASQPSLCDVLNLYTPGWNNGSSPLDDPPEGRVLMSALMASPRYLADIMKRWSGIITNENIRRTVFAKRYILDAALTVFGAMNAQTLNSILDELYRADAWIVSFAGASEIADLAPENLAKERKVILDRQADRSRMRALEAGAGPRNVGPIKGFFDRNGDSALSRRVFGFMEHA
jgi:hypothetical protein